MTIFEQRMQAVILKLRERTESAEYQQLTNWQKTASNRQILRDSREGDYLIKVSRNNVLNFCGEDQQYIDYTYIRHGWFALGSRKDAQWFTGVEAYEWLKGKKGFTIVKRKR